MRANAVSRLAASVADVAGAEVELERPSDPAHGDYATNVALRLAGVQRRAPRELAAELAEKVAELPEVERAEVAGPGFLNLFVTDAFLAAALEEVGEGYGAGSAIEPERVDVEMVSANPTGPIPVSAARNGAYGDSVARLLEFAGHEVVREFYYNDAGAQMERFRESVEAARRGEDPPEDGYRGAYINELAQLEGDPVQQMVRRIEDSLERFRIHFDVWTLQSVIAKSAGDAIASIETYEKEGTVWARTTDYGDDKDRPLVRSSDGSFLYFAADVAYVRDKFERGFDRLIYVLGADHHGYVARLKAVAAMLGYDVSRLEVLLYQTVHLTKAGEQTKMSKRRGDIVFLEDLMDEVGVDAARWYLVNRGPDQAIDIDIDLAAEKSQKNPVYYVQYAHARVAGILRNAPVPSPRTRDNARSAAGGRRAGPDQAARGVPGHRRRSDGATRAAQHPDLRDSRRGRLPSLLPRAPRARVRAARLSARAVPRDAAGHRAQPRSDRRRGSRPHVKRLVLVTVVLLAGCGGGGKDRVSGPPLPEIAKRCGAAHADWKTLWLKASDGTKLDGAEAGSGDRGVLMLHESLGDLCGWEPYAAELVRQGFHVLLVDLRAYGLSQRGPYGGRRGAVADVRGAVDELKHRGAKKVAVVGASYGGVTALAAAPALGQQIAGVASLSGELELKNAKLNALAAMPNIQVPVLIMGSRKDPYLDETDARELVQNATAANAQLVEFDGTAHGWNLLDPPHKQRAYAFLVGFLRSVTQ